jgi:RNA polymerase sigma-70 factor (ECF subfamily)
LSDERLDAEEEGRTIERARRGDMRAFERLYRAHAGWVYGLCLRLLGEHGNAEDCTQDTFVAAWRALPRFEQRSRFGTWLHRIAVNTVLGQRRTPRLQLVSSETHAEELSSLAAPGDGGLPIDLERAIARLPPGARDVLVLVGLYGYSHEEAAEALGIAVGTSKAQLHRARGLLSAQHLGPELTAQTS